jgi:hypothetical protein
MQLPLFGFLARLAGLFVSKKAGFGEFGGDADQPPQRLCQSLSMLKIKDLEKR